MMSTPKPLHDTFADRSTKISTALPRHRKAFQLKRYPTPVEDCGVIGVSKFVATQ